MPHYKKEDMLFLPLEGSGLIPICPACKEHGHDWITDREKHLDCKNTYTAESGYDGQCCCYSKEHGMRD